MIVRSVDVEFGLAKAWALRGNEEAALAGFERVVTLDPAHVQARIELAGLLLRRGLAREALVHYEQALALTPDDRMLQFRHAHVTRLLAAGTSTPRAEGSPHAVAPILAHDNPLGKIDLRNQATFKAHRSGWGYALDALAPLHNRRGVHFDGFLERNFAWRHWQEGCRSPEVLRRMRREGTFDELATSEERGITPYTRPWIGFLHNPQAMPTWFHPQESPQAIFQKAIWKRSQEACLGLLTLSDYHAAWLRQATGKPVSVLTAPTEIPALQFDFARFAASHVKKIVQIGWWLRKLSAIYRLPIPRDNLMGYEKVRLVPDFFGNAAQYLASLLEREIALEGRPIDPAFASNTRELQHLPDDEYDVLLSENIALVELYDASANNAVVECIARATPLLINPLPAVVEYLGADYPMYFATLAEAAEKALDMALIYDTHLYLKGCETRPKLSGDRFRRDFEASEVYRLI